MTEAVRANPRRLDHFVSKPVGREMLLYDSEKDVVHILNSTAKTVWDLCDAQHTPAAIAAELRARFSFFSQHSDVLADVHEVLGRFAAVGLIDWGSVPTDAAQ